MPFHNHMSQMWIKLGGDKLYKVGGVTKNGGRNLKLGGKCVAHNPNKDMKIW